MSRRWLSGLLAVLTLVGVVGSGPPAGAVTGWRDVPIPAPAAPSTFDHIAAGDALHAWVVGRENGARPGEGTPVMLRWDGTAWGREQGFPRVDEFVGALSAASATDAWAFGTSGGQWQAWHWEGSAWKAYLLPDQEGADVLVHQPLAAARGAAWAASESFFTSVVWHWDGRAWARQQVPEGVAVFGLGARTAADAWAVGHARDGTTDAAAMRWDGTAWRVVDTTGLTGALIRVLPVSATSVYAVGSDNGFYLAHWDGGGWTRSALPVTTNAVNAIATDGGERIWLAVQSDHAFQSLYLRYAGGRWSRVYGPDRADVVEVKVNDIARVPGTRTLWSAGSAEVFQRPVAAIIEERP